VVLRPAPLPSRLPPRLPDRQLVAKPIVMVPGCSEAQEHDAPHLIDDYDPEAPRRAGEKADELFREIVRRVAASKGK
jgi:hypothetical protein